MNIFKHTANYILPPALIFLDCIFPTLYDAYVFHVIITRSTH